MNQTYNFFKSGAIPWKYKKWGELFLKYCWNIEFICFALVGSMILCSLRMDLYGFICISHLMVYKDLKLLLGLNCEIWTFDSHIF